MAQIHPGAVRLASYQLEAIRLFSSMVLWTREWLLTLTFLFYDSAEIIVNNGEYAMLNKLCNDIISHHSRTHTDR